MRISGIMPTFGRFNATLMNTRKFIRSFTAAIAAICTLTLSCKPDSAEEPEEEQVQEYLDLLDAYEKGYVYTGADQTSTHTILHFEQLSDLYIKTSSLRIHDHTSSAIPTISLNSNGIWQIDGSLTGIRLSHKTDSESKPVYVCFDQTTLHIYVSNEHHITFAYREPEKPKSIPTVRLYTKNKAQIKDRENYVEGSIQIEDPDCIYSEDTLYEGSMRIRGRGNSTWDMPKKPYKIKLDEKASLLGMPKDKEWCLLANYSDKTLLRNLTAMEISRILEMAWTPRMRSVDVYLNGEYIGVYTLAEHKKVAKNRVNIDTDAGDIYMEIEQNQDEPRCFWTGMGVPMMFSDPDEPTDEVFNSTVQYFKDFEAALTANDFTDPEKGYAAYIDVDSFVNYYIIQELVKNIDGNLRKSSFLTKTPTGKLVMYHVWDFDLTMGNCDYFDSAVGNTYTNFFIKDYGAWGRNTSWYHRLFQDPAFVDKVQARWKEVLPQLKTVPDYIDEQHGMLFGAEDRNFERWDILNKYVWPNAKVLGTYTAELNFLKDFYNGRLNWLDTNLMKL